MATIRIKKTVEEPPKSAASNSSIDKSVLVRDMINGLVGGRYTNISSKEAQDNYSGLQSMLGTKKAQDILNKIVIYNQDNRYKALPLEERITSFYETGKGDPVIKEARSLGYGVLPSFRSSPNYLTQSLQGMMPKSTSIAEISSPVDKNILLRVNK